MIANALLNAIRAWYFVDDVSHDHLEWVPLPVINDLMFIKDVEYRHVRNIPLQGLRDTFN